MDDSNPEQTEAAWDHDAKLEILAEAGGTLVVGNPARIIGYVCACGQRVTFSGDKAACGCGRSLKKSADGRVSMA